MASADSDSEESRNLNSIFLSCPHISDRIFGFLEDDDLQYLKGYYSFLQEWHTFSFMFFGQKTFLHHLAILFLPPTN